jgi:hypothetical protein
VYILLKLIVLFASTRYKDIFLRKEYESGAIMFINVNFVKGSLHILIMS